MKWHSVLSDQPNLEEAVQECSQKIKREFKSPIDLLMLFLSPHYARSYHKVPELIHKLLNPKVFLGCSAGGVIGGGKEVEQRAALTLMAAHLPEVQIRPLHILNHSLPDMDDRPKSWHDLVKLVPENDPHFILFSDPFSFDVDKFAMGMDYAFSKSVKVGGLVSGGQGAKENALFLNGEMFQEGMVSTALFGNITVDTVVAQGCRPIGEPMIVTGCQKNVLLELEQKPPMKILEELFETLPSRDRQLLRTSLFLGIVMDPSRNSYNRGDFLIRNIIGADPEKGILAIGAELRAGQTVQFHLRDSQTSTEDLDLMFSRYTGAKGNQPLEGALLFSCLGRGTYLYGAPDHDTKLFQDKIGKVPLGGFFCNGEIGPVNHTTYIHGYTSCFAIFKEKDRKSLGVSGP